LREGTGSLRMGKLIHLRTQALKLRSHCADALLAQVLIKLKR
jgi:hypothetical protein